MAVSLSVRHHPLSLSGGTSCGSLEIACLGANKVEWSKSFLQVQLTLVQTSDSFDTDSHFIIPLFVDSLSLCLVKNRSFRRTLGWRMHRVAAESVHYSDKKNSI